MQIICALKISAQDYVAADYQKKILPPDRCPHCGNSKSFRALGYYGRYLSGIDGKIKIRRFRCRLCKQPVSMLPWFIQPYRFLQNHLLDVFSEESLNDHDVVRWHDLLQSHWRQFARKLPDLAHAIRGTVANAPKANDPKRWWSFLRLQYGNAAEITQTLVTRFQRTLFGKYACHTPIPPTSPILVPDTS